MNVPSSLEGSLGPSTSGRGGWCFLMADVLLIESLRLRIDSPPW